MTPSTRDLKESLTAMAHAKHPLSSLPMIALLVAACAGLTACGNLEKDRMATSAVPDDYRTRHPIMLSEVEHTLDLPIASGDRELTIGLQDSIAGFANDYRGASSGTIQIMIPQGSANAAAANVLKKEIRKVLTTAGVQPTRLIETVYQAEANDGVAPVRLSYVAITATTNPCGEWPEDIQNNTYSNRNYHNFGCATQSNLAAQIANPMDLVTPRAMSPIDATRRSTVIGLYRKGSNTATK